MTAFAETLEYGLAGESAIAGWLKSHGYTILPVYEKIFDSGKGPQLYTPEDALIAPDLLVYRGNRVLWIEAKRKTAFSWHRLTRRWVTGIDLRHYEDYCRVADCAPWPVWLLFLHEGGQAKDSPPNSPAGLFGETLAYLRGHENHRHENWGVGGMVYWAVEHLRQLAGLSDVLQAER
ncbi:MAG: hypothetical protein RBR02_11370 [Desulfuromonadaceae bacterium]|nr:hypothetical protein [Desulfuromonadaceae bacterium]